MPHLEDWTKYPNGCLGGRVYSHPYKADGSSVRTSRVVATGTSRTVRTESGTVYTLGKASEYEVERAMRLVGPARITEADLDGYERNVARCKLDDIDSHIARHTLVEICMELIRDIRARLLAAQSTQRVR